MKQKFPAKAQRRKEKALSRTLFNLVSVFLSIFLCAFAPLRETLPSTRAQSQSDPPYKNPNLPIEQRVEDLLFPTPEARAPCVVVDGLVEVLRVAMTLREIKEVAQVSRLVPEPLLEEGGVFPVLLDGILIARSIGVAHDTEPIEFSTVERLAALEVFVKHALVAPGQRRYDERRTVPGHG